MSDSTENSVRKDDDSADSISKIPGGVHLLTIRNALKNKHASVMIGSGFSLNAEGGNKLKTWGPLVDSLLGDLYASEELKKRAKDRLGGTSGMLRLTQEYETLRGRAQLDARFHELLPDTGVVTPGKLHTKLLALPWTDVFTTNYDTLLERTIDIDRSNPNPAIERRYQIVASPEGVPHSRRNGQPRIVKLHGTLRSGSPLIITEEDYRKYPKEFAPFVNTVQQSMLENVFCLIGFSGDDPNFLAWTGWARDHLGEKAASIYLISLSPLSDGQRLILERRRIFPIDISSLGKTATGEINYLNALDAVFRYWESEPARDEIDWPYRRPYSSLPHSDASLLDISNWLQVARRNRADYPGWLVAPAKNRSRLNEVSGIWKIFDAIQRLEDDMPRWLHLLVIDEIRWIAQICFAGLSSELEIEIDNALETEEEASAVAPELSPAALGVARPSPKELAAIEARLILELLRKAREQNQKEIFDKLRVQLDEEYASVSAELRCAVLYEQILFKLEHSDVENIRSLLVKLDKLDGPNVDPYWAIRVGSIMGEMGNRVKGQEVVFKGLQKIRKAIQVDGENTFFVSRKLWAEWVLRAFIVPGGGGKQSKKKVERNPKKWLPNPELQDQLDQLDQDDAGSYQFFAEETSPKGEAKRRDNVERPSFLMEDARREVDIAEREIRQSRVSVDAITLPTLVRSPSLRLDEASDAAATYVRLIEQTALPPFVEKVVFSSRHLLSAFKIQSTITGADSYWRIFRRAAAGPDFSAPQAIDLETVSTLAHESAYELFNKMILAVERIRPDSELDDDALRQVKLRLDCLSRNAFRLEAKDAERLCRLAIELYQNQGFRKWREYSDILSTVFARTFRLLDEETIARLEPKLLSLSVDDDESVPRGYSWPEVVQYLPRRPFLAPSVEWEVVVDSALEDFYRLKRLTNDEKKADKLSSCVRRLDWLYYRKCMTPVQQQRFGDLLWRNVSRRDVPRFNSFYGGAFVVWPKPAARPAMKELFKSYLLRVGIDDIEKTTNQDGKQRTALNRPSEDFLISLLLSVQKESNITWTEAELVELMEPIIAWWEREGAHLVQRVSSRRDGSVRELLGARLLRISQVIHQVFSTKISHATLRRHRLDEWLETFWNAGASAHVPLVPLLFAGLNWWPEHSRRVINQAIGIVQSNYERAVVIYALIAGYEWIKAQRQSTFETNRYATFLLDGILSGPCYLVEQKLNTIREMLVDGGSIHLHSLRRQLSSNLYMTWIQLEGRNSGPVRLFEDSAKPLLKVAVVKVLVALGARFPEAKQDQCWRLAIESARKDPLQIVRRLVANIPRAEPERKDAIAVSN